MLKVGHCTSAVTTAGPGCVLLTGFLGLSSNTCTGEMWTHTPSYSTERPQWCQRGLKTFFLGRAGLLWTICTASFWEAGHPGSTDNVSAKSLVAGTATPWEGSRPLAQSIHFPQQRPCSVMLWQLPARGKQGWRNTVLAVLSLPVSLV